MDFWQSSKSNLFKQSYKIYQFDFYCVSILAFWRTQKQVYCSLHREDLFLLEYFSGKIGAYVDVVAHHSFRYSNTYLLQKPNINPRDYAEDGVISFLTTKSYRFI